MSHRTIRERTYLITMRNIGQWIFDPNEGGNRPIDSAHQKFAVYMPGLVQQLEEYDMKKETTEIPTPTNQKQQVIVNQQSEKFFINPITSFKATASDTWSALIRNITEAFLKNPLTNKVGKALTTPDYDRARELIPDLQSRVGPDSYDALITSIKATI